MRQVHLDLEQLPDLWARTKAGDLRARDTLVEGYIWLAVRLARDKRVPDGVDREDLLSWAAAGLFDAVTKFDPDTSDGQFHKHFLSYASMRVRGAILDGLKSPSISWASRNTWRRLKDQQAAEEALTQELGRAPTRVEIAGRLKMDVSEFETLRQTISITATGFVGDEDEESFDEFAGADATDEQADYHHMAARMAQALTVLSSVETEVMTLLYFRHLNLTQAAKELGTTTPRVREIRDQALGSVRAALQSA